LADAANGLACGGVVADDLTREELQRLARLGAKSRLEELRREEAAIRQAFPDLVGGRAGRAGSAGQRGRGGRRQAADASDAAPTRRRRRRSNMSAAARKAVSERMKKYWAARRKDKK
jgi:hypothetical protein